MALGTGWNIHRSLPALSIHDSVDCKGAATQLIWGILCTVSERCPSRQGVTSQRKVRWAFAVWNCLKNRPLVLLLAELCANVQRFNSWSSAGGFEIGSLTIAWTWSWRAYWNTDVSMGSLNRFSSDNRWELLLNMLFRLWRWMWQTSQEPFKTISGPFSRTQLRNSPGGMCQRYCTSSCAKFRF